MAASKTKRKKIQIPESKPVRPEEPKYENYRQFSRYMGDVNYKGDPVKTNPEFHQAYDEWRAAKEKYEEDIVIWEQYKMIKLIKNADPQLILRKYRIEKIG